MLVALIAIAVLAANPDNRVLGLGELRLGLDSARHLDLLLSCFL